MYEYLNGKIIEISPTNIVVDVAGIGYNLMISLRTYEIFCNSNEALIYTHQYFLRDDLPVLYGFSEKQEREIFKLLISVSGVGGNTARTILSTFNSAELQQIISSSNSTMLSKVKGLGQKTSEKVIVELRDKIINVSISDDNNATTAGVIISEVFNEATRALTLLGFKKDVSQKSVRAILNKEPNLSLEDVIKRSLKNM